MQWVEEDWKLSFTLSCWLGIDFVRLSSGRLVSQRSRESCKHKQTQANTSKNTLQPSWPTTNHYFLLVALFLASSKQIKRFSYATRMSRGPRRCRRHPKCARCKGKKIISECAICIRAQLEHPNGLSLRKLSKMEINDALIRLVVSTFHWPRQIFKPDSRSKPR